MKTNRNDIYVVKKKSIYNLSQQRTDYKSPYFDSTFSALAALIRWRSRHLYMPGSTDKFLFAPKKCTCRPGPSRSENMELKRFLIET